MMKFSVAFMALLHVCLSFNFSMNLNNELITGLEKLNSALPTRTLLGRVPSRAMLKNPKHCLGVFIKELQNTLNVTVPEEHMSIVRGIQANLNLMGEHRENSQDCPMARWRGQPFPKFIRFVMKLNSQLQ